MDEYKPIYVKKIKQSVIDKLDKRAEVINASRAFIIRLALDEFVRQT